MNCIRLKDMTSSGKSEEPWRVRHEQVTNPGDLLALDPLQVFGKAAAVFSVFFAVLPWFFVLLLGVRGLATPVNYVASSSMVCFGLLFYAATLLISGHVATALSDHLRESPCLPDDKTLQERLITLVPLLLMGLILLGQNHFSWLFLYIPALILFDGVGRKQAVLWCENHLRSRILAMTPVSWGPVANPACPEPDSSVRPMLRIVNQCSLEEQNESDDNSVILNMGDTKLTQYQSRRFDENDNEIIEGMVRVSFRDQEEFAVIHLAFCPPLDYTPQLECETDSENDLETHVSQIQPFGARIELKRPRRLAPENAALFYFVGSNDSTVMK